MNPMTSTTATAAMGDDDPTQAGPLSVFELSLDASSDIAGLARAIRSLSANVAEVRVDIYNSFTTRWDEEGVSHLFEVLGEVPHLTKIEFYGLRIFPYVMPIAMAERTLARATTLQEFSLVGVHLTARNATDFPHFTKTLKRHSSLKVFGLDNCRLREGPTLDEAVVSALVEIPSLEKVVIRAMEASMWGTLSCKSVALLCRSTTLKNLELFVFSHCSSSQSSFLKEMARTLIDYKDTSQLEEVSVSGCLGGMEGARLVSKMIRTNNKLKSLEIHLRERSEQEDEAGIMELSKALAKNNNLERFQLHGATDKSGSLGTRRAYLDMLESNYALIHGIQVFHPGFLRPQNELYLRLNKFGRGKLLSNINADKKEWVTTLARVSDDIDCLYYLLHRNPLLCDVSTSAITEKKERCETPEITGASSIQTIGHESTRKRKRPEGSFVPGLVTP